MARFDRRTKARLLMALSIVVLLALGALRPESYPLLRAVVLIPGAFLVVALALLFVPLWAMTSAEAGERMGWRRVLDAMEHNTILLVVLVMVLVAAGLVSFLNLATMRPYEMAIFFGALAVGIGGAVWGLARGVRPRRGDASGTKDEGQA